ncbi:MAG: hypothetical protein D6E12_17180 [Desulfovibrio sp.]|nr:MAG: hypothetical protein D6E12_17180 [Desulfovibrio sp.]
MAGITTLAVAVFQAVISFSVEWSRYFGAPEELLQEPVWLIAVGLIVAVILAVFGLYALSCAGWIRRLPLRRTITLVAGIIFLLRGLGVIPELLIMWGIIEYSMPMPPQAIASSLVSLVIGIMFFLGIIGGWRALGSASPSV